MVENLSRTFVQLRLTSYVSGTNILLSTLFSNTSLTVRDKVSQSYKMTGNIVVLHILIIKV
jgi:hypothetical protein